MQSNTGQNKLLDVLKYISAVLVLASHCLPIVPNELFNFFYGQWFFRFCVPFFIISSGYFFTSFNKEGKRKYIKRIAVLYIIASLLYLPTYINWGIWTIIQNLIFGYHHLWYLSALAISLCLCYTLENIPFVKKIYTKIYPFIAVVLIIVGAYYDEYKYVFADLYDIPVVKIFGKLIKYMGGPRHALFFTLPMFLIGKLICDYKDKVNLQKNTCIFLIILSFGFSFAECVLLRHFGGNSITCDITLINYFPAVFLFILTLTYQPKILKNIPTKSLRKNADTLYVLHIMILFIVDRFFDVKYALRFFLILIISSAVSWVCLKIIGTITKKNTIATKK